MTQKDNILQELKELRSTLANVDLQNIYMVPNGYFDALADQVLNRIKAIEAATPVEELSHLSSMLTNISKQLPYSVPTGYFEGLAEKAIKTVHESNDYQTAKEELKILSPLLSGLQKQMPYTVPQGYFETLSGNINTEKNKSVKKIVSITSHKWLRYAAAAVITGLILLAGFLYFGGEKVPGDKALAKLTRDVKKMNEAQKDTLIDFIDAGMSGKETVRVNTDNKSNEVKDLLQGVSEEELKDFQEQTEDIQDVLMTN